MGFVASLRRNGTTGNMSFSGGGGGFAGTNGGESPRTGEMDGIGESARVGLRGKLFGLLGEASPDFRRGIVTGGGK